MHDKYSTVFSNKKKSSAGSKPVTKKFTNICTHLWGEALQNSGSDPAVTGAMARTRLLFLLWKRWKLSPLLTGELLQSFQHLSPDMQKQPFGNAYLVPLLCKKPAWARVCLIGTARCSGVYTASITVVLYVGIKIERVWSFIYVNESTGRLPLDAVLTCCM